MNWTLTIPGRPKTVNQFMKLVPHARSDAKVPWRKAAAKAAQDANVLCTRPVSVTVTPQLRGQRKQDVGACFLAAKACIDGLVDAFAMPDDDAEHLIALTFRPAVYGCDEDSLRLDIEEAHSVGYETPEGIYEADVPHGMSPSTKERWRKAGRL